MKNCFVCDHRTWTAKKATRYSEYVNDQGFICDKKNRVFDKKDSCEIASTCSDYLPFEDIYNAETGKKATFHGINIKEEEDVNKFSYAPKDTDYGVTDMETYQRIPFRKFIESQGKKVYINMDEVPLIEEIEDDPDFCMFYLNCNTDLCIRRKIRINFNDIFKGE